RNDHGAPSCAAKMSVRIHIGTSGWHYKHWRGSFYGPDVRAADMFRFYVHQFDTVEMNNSFYRLPTTKALRDWKDAAPNKFCFAVKASRFLTHMKKLKDPKLGLRRFFARVETLGRNLRPILFQLPPRWQCNFTRLACFLAALPGNIGLPSSFVIRLGITRRFTSCCAVTMLHLCL